MTTTSAQRRHVGRNVAGMSDLLDDAQTPRCPECATVLRDAGHGYACQTCRIVVIGSIPST
ncbi:hypothetical protein ACI3KX_09820 [Microbacterium sp. ZW CA_36]|uniref:hypothetical protein n=1 Tax=Microbacterium sp. ZW CA_36 TaxID=3378078 RepID=UPI0038531C2A